MNLIHLEHPSQRTPKLSAPARPAIRPPGGSLSERRVDHFPSGASNGKEVTVELNQADPGTSGKHFHPAHSFTYVLEGSETYTLEGQGPNTVKVGDVLHEAPTQLHTVENLSPVKLLVVRVIEKGKAPTVRLQ